MSCSNCDKDKPEVSFSGDDRYCLNCRREKNRLRELGRREAGLCRCGRVPIEGESGCGL